MFCPLEWYQWLVISLDLDLLADDVIGELATDPCGDQCLLFNLRIAAFCVCHRPRGICDWLPH